MQKAHMVRGAPWAVAGRQKDRAELTKRLYHIVTVSQGLL